jgi:hypothetical protein
LTLRGWDFVVDDDDHRAWAALTSAIRIERVIDKLTSRTKDYNLSLLYSHLHLAVYEYNILSNMQESSTAAHDFKYGMGWNVEHCHHASMFPLM